jgi:hypothetical protein
VGSVRLGRGWPGQEAAPALHHVGPGLRELEGENKFGTRLGRKWDLASLEECKLLKLSGLFTRHYCSSF